MAINKDILTRQISQKFYMDINKKVSEMIWNLESDKCSKYTSCSVVLLLFQNVC